MPFTGTSRITEALTQEQQEATAEFHRQFPEWNDLNLETNGVLMHENFCYVDERHPVIHLLKSNQDKIMCKMDEIPTHSMADLPGKWYKMKHQVLHTCCDTIRSIVIPQTLPQVNHTDGHKHSHLQAN